MGYRLGVDVGGTFTDLVLFDEKRNQLEFTKVSSRSTCRLLMLRRVSLRSLA